MRTGNHFYISGFALSLVLKQRLGKTRKWPVDLLHCITDSSRANVTTKLRSIIAGKCAERGSSYIIIIIIIIIMMMMMMIVYSTFLQHKLNYKAGH